MSSKTEREEKKAETEKETEEKDVAYGQADVAGPPGPVLTPIDDVLHVREPQILAPVGTAEEQAKVAKEGAKNVEDAWAIDDGVEDIELGPPVLGSFVRITAGNYAGHFAAYLGNVELDKDGQPTLIQVRTRDADNVLVDVPYDEVTATTYSGGR